MANKTFDLYFFYYNRKKIRDSIFLEMFPSFIKGFILKHYAYSNYKRVNQLIILAKLILVSLLYFIVYMSIRITNETAQVLPYSIYIIIGFFSTLTLLEYNKKAIPDIEHDHYFRMLGENRNELVKEVMKRRIIYAFTNWLIPLTLFPVIYTSIVSGYQSLLFYLVVTIFFYFMTSIFIFLSQRILYDYLRNIVFVDVIVEWLFLAIIFAFTFLFAFSPVTTLSFISIQSLQIIANIVMYSIMILFLYFINRKIIQSAMHYSLTNTVILGKKSRVKTNQIKYPNLFLRLVLGKNNFQNKLLTKDLVTYYRKSKQDFIMIIIFGIMSGVYGAMLTTSLLNDPRDILSTLFVDNIFLSVVAIFFTMVFYRMKDISWYSSEGINLLMYGKMGYGKYDVYKVKQKLNYLIISPLIILYTLMPVFFIGQMEVTNILYALLRVPLIFMYFTIIIDYSLLQDTIRPRKNAYDGVSGLGLVNITLLIIFVQGIGLSQLLAYANRGNTIVSDIKYLEWIVFAFLLLIMTMVKFTYRMKEKKLKGQYEEGKIYA